MFDRRATGVPPTLQARTTGALMVPGLLLIALMLGGCGSSSSSSGSAGSVESGEPTVQEATTTMPTETDGSAEVPAGEGFVLAERELFGRTSQQLVSTVTRLSDDLPIELGFGVPGEDRQERTVLVLPLPLSRLGDVEGFYLLSIAPAGPGPLLIRQAEWRTGPSAAELVLETKSDGPPTATWSYSLRPRMRPVFLADVDSELGVDGSVLHTADFGPGPAEAKTQELEDGWVRLTLETPLWLIDQTPLAEACERVLAELDDRIGAEDLSWPLASVDETVLDGAATAIEQSLLANSQQVNLTLSTGSREIVRGKRLQPLVAYPVTLLDEDGNPAAGVLGCSISPS